MPSIVHIQDRKNTQIFSQRDPLPELPIVLLHLRCDLQVLPYLSNRIDAGEPALSYALLFLLKNLQFAAVPRIKL